MYYSICTNFAINVAGKRNFAPQTFSLKHTNQRFFYLCLMMIGLLAFQAANAQSTTKFNDGYLSVFKVTSGSALANTGTAIVVEEYIFSGASQSAPNFSVSVPSTFASPNKRVVVPGTGTSAGAMTRAENGRFLIIPGFDTIVGIANTTFTVGALRTVNGTGTVNAGIQGAFQSSTANAMRGGATDDGTNYWVSGSNTGSQTSTNGTTITNIATGNSRVTHIHNGQLYMSLAGALHQIGTGKPTTSSSTTAFLTLNAGNTSIYSFAVSPDFLTVYTTDDGASKGVYRYTYNGTYSSGAYSGGTWSSNLITSQTGTTGIAVDWSNYSFATTANGARLFYTNPTTLNTALDNGTGTLTATTLRTISGNNAFRGIAFSPIRQTVSLGANSPAASNKPVGTSNTVLFQFNLAATEGNSSIKKVIINNGGTAVLNTDITNFRLYDDINGDGIINGSDSVLSTGSVSGSNITFASINLSSYISESSSKNFIVVGNIASGATISRTFIPSIVANKTLNTLSYTTNLTNVSSSYVLIGGTAPTGNTITISSANPVAPTSGGNQTGCSAGTIPNLSATAGIGEVVDWYANSSGGSALQSGSNTYSTGQTTAGVYTYYAEARNTTTSLVSASRTAVSLTITQSITPSVTATVDDNTPAAGQTINFSIASSTNRGTTPTYQWYKNNGTISGANDSTYSTSSNYATGDSFYVRMTSNATCPSPATVQSAAIYITIDVSACSGTPPTANAVATATNVCAGGSSNLSLTGLGGATGYTYQWQTATTQGGSYSDVGGQTGNAYAATNITNSLWYKCNVTCSHSGVSTASNAVQINVTANLTPSVSIASSASPACAGASVTFTATPTNGGASPSLCLVFEW